jgi:hypothetical protein
VGLFTGGPVGGIVGAILWAMRGQRQAAEERLAAARDARTFETRVLARAFAEEAPERLRVAFTRVFGREP